MEQNLFDMIFLLILMSVNAFAFIPQAVRVYRTKSSKGVSPWTYLIFLVIQGYLVFHSFYYNHDFPLAIGYLLSMATCSTLLVLLWIFRAEHTSKNQFSINLTEVFSQFPGHLYLKDKDGVTQWCNTNNWKDFGYSSLESFIGKTDHELFSKEDAEKLWNTDQEVMRSGVSVVAEEYFSLKEKDRLYLSLKSPLRNQRGDVIGIIGTSVDITDAKQEISEKLAMLDNIIAAMPGNVYWMNREGIYLGCNDNEAQSIGLTSRRDIVGKRNADIPGFLIPEALDPVNQSIMESGQAISLEEPARLLDNTDAVFASSKVPLKDTAGKVIGLLGISIDITEKKKAEQELLKAKKQAEAANRAKTEFLANMSHDVKTPLSGVIGMAELMMHDFTGSDRQRAEAIYACGMQLLAFFNSCLDLSKLEMMEWASKEEVFSLGKLLHEIGALFSPSAQMKGLEFVVEADSALPSTVRGHHASVYRVMLNLAGNALKFTQHGSVKIRAFLSETLSSNQIFIGLEVKDTGIGIPAEQHEVIFEKLRRLTPAYEGKIEGSGIGLYIVDQYVKRMGGKIQVESSEGKGSTFTVFLPMMIVSEGDLHAQENVDGFSLSYIEPSAVAFSKAPLPLEKKDDLAENAPRILLVEDNSLIQSVTQALLNGLGFVVDVAGTGSEAIEKFSPGNYALIYMDIGLPDQDGYSVTQVIREKEARVNASAVPIIALTAHGAVDVEAFCGRAGMQGVLSKPLTREQAKAVWGKFGLGKSERVAGLKLIRHAEATPQTGQIIDMDGTISLLGTKEYAEELLALWFEMLTQRFLPALKDFVEKRDDEALRQELHNMLGSLCYVKAPLLNQAVLELQTAARNHPQSIESVYQHVLQEAQRFIKHYSAMTLTK